MLWMTVYLWKSGERAKTIEAEWCANALWWTLGNYVYYALTSKNLRVKIGSTETTISPTYYLIELTGGTQTSDKRCTPENIWSWYFCQEIVLWYSETTWFVTEPPFSGYQTVTVSNTCRHGKPYLWFYRSWWTHTWNIDYIRMNKWFTAREISAERVFFLHDNYSEGGEPKEEKLLLWDIIVVLCSNETCKCPENNPNCEPRKQIGKRQVDARSQTIDFKKCRYYFDGEHSNICKTREDCRVYSGSDPTACEKY